MSKLLAIINGMPYSICSVDLSKLTESEKRKYLTELFKDELGLHDAEYY